MPAIVLTVDLSIEMMRGKKTLRADAALDTHLLAKIRCLSKGVEPTL